MFGVKLVGLCAAKEVRGRKRGVRIGWAGVIALWGEEGRREKVGGGGEGGGGGGRGEEQKGKGKLMVYEIFV